MAGIPTQPHTFFIGVVNGGVWKTTDAGRTWTPIFDDQPTGAIGLFRIVEQTDATPTSQVVKAVKATLAAAEAATR